MLRSILSKLLLFTLFTAFVACSSKTEKDKTIATVSKQTITDHIYYIASDEMRGRDVGSPEILKAADYLADQLRSYGAKPIQGANGYFQPVPLRKRTPAKKASFSFAGKTFNLADHFWIFDGQSGDFEADIVFLNYGMEDDYEGVDVSGKFVFAKTGDGVVGDWRAFRILSREKAILARSKGAAGLIEFYSAPTPLAQLAPALNATGFVIDEAGAVDKVLPHLWLNDPNGENLSLMKRKGIKRGKLSIDGMTNAMTQDRNVVAMIEGSDPELNDEFVMFSAHYDHIGVGQPDAQGDSIYNGTRDNAVGIASVLTLAENVGKFPMKRSAIFAFLTAEEKGLLGSRWLANNPLIPNEQIIFCWNSDNASYTDTSLATIFGLTRTTAEPMIKEAASTFGLDVIEDPTIEQIGGLFERSDNVNFARQGIPAPTYSLGFRGFDPEIIKYYHNQADNPNTVDYDYLFRFFQSYVLVSRMIGNSLDRPFWVEGDKFYDAGIQLYGELRD